MGVDTRDGRPGVGVTVELEEAASYSDDEVFGGLGSASRFRWWPMGDGCSANCARATSARTAGWTVGPGGRRGALPVIEQAEVGSMVAVVDRTPGSPPCRGGRWTAVGPGD